MRAKFTNFKEDSDPVQDMGIGMDEVIKRWVETNGHFSFKEHDFLWVCAAMGKVDFVKYLLQQGYDVHYKSDIALRRAAENGHANVVKLLLDAGADVHANNDYALEWSSAFGHADVVKLLLDAGAQSKTNNALSLAKLYDRKEVVQLLKQYNKKPIKESVTHFKEDSDPVHDMGVGMDVIIKRWVENETEYTYKKDSPGLLWICAKYGKIEFVKYLLSQGVDVHFNDDYALIKASEMGRTEIVKLLLDAGANPGAQHGTALAMARLNDDYEMFELLQNHLMKQRNIVKESITHFKEDSDPVHDMDIGIDVEIKHWVENETEYTYKKEDLLWICAEYGKTEFVKYLLKQGYDVHANNDHALRNASYNGHTEIVKLLLDAGANVHTQGDILLRFLSEYGNTEIVKLLLDAGADVHADNDYALRWASYYGHAKTVKILLDAGADVHAANNEALHWAKVNLHHDIVKILQDHIAKENKIVKESITHFKEDSDPIADMDIGMLKIIKDWAKIQPIPIKSIGKDNELLWICALAGKIDYVEYLLGVGYDVHAHDNKALKLASGEGHIEVVKLLLDAGADVHADDDHALRLASTNGHTEVVKLLLDAGANVHADKKAALELARIWHHYDVLEVLQDHIEKEKIKNKSKK